MPRPAFASANGSRRFLRVAGVTLVTLSSAGICDTGRTACIKSNDRKPKPCVHGKSRLYRRAANAEVELGNESDYEEMISRFLSSLRAKESLNKHRFQCRG